MSRLFGLCLLFTGISTLPALVEAIPSFTNTRSIQGRTTLHRAAGSIIDVRGGATRSKAPSRTGKTATGKTKIGAKNNKEKPNVFSAFYKSLMPVTKYHAGTAVGLTVAGILLGDELTQQLFSLDPIRSIYGKQIWRFLTAGSYFGPPSMGFLFGIYYLLKYGSDLEKHHGSAQHLILLLTQLVVLSSCCMLLGLPFFATPLITAVLHVLCRTDPHSKVRWFVIEVPFWLLPYGMAITDVCQQQTLTAAVPHILGMLTGHFYEFHKNIWPKVRGEDWLVAPGFVSAVLDPDSVENKADAPKRKRTKGRKLGSKK